MKEKGEFLSRLSEEVFMILPRLNEDYNLVCKSIRNNDEIHKPVIFFRSNKDDNTYFRMISLDYFYNRYLQGDSISNIAQMVVAYLGKSRVEVDKEIYYNISNGMIEKVDDRLYLSLVGSFTESSNLEMITVGDMVFTCYIDMSPEKNYMSGVPVNVFTPVKLEDVYEKACINMINNIKVNVSVDGMSEEDGEVYSILDAFEIIEELYVESPQIVILFKPANMAVAFIANNMFLEEIADILQSGYCITYLMQGGLAITKMSYDKAELFAKEVTDAIYKKALSMNCVDLMLTKHIYYYNNENNILETL